MTIVPDREDLVVETRVPPQHIKEVRLGQTAVPRFTNFNQRTTPEIDSEVSRVCADV